MWESRLTDGGGHKRLTRRFLAAARSVLGVVVVRSGCMVDGFVGSAEFTSSLPRASSYVLIFGHVGHSAIE